MPLSLSACTPLNVTHAGWAQIWSNKLAYECRNRSLSSWSPRNTLPVVLSMWSWHCLRLASGVFLHTASAIYWNYLKNWKTQPTFDEPVSQTKSSYGAQAAMWLLFTPHTSLVISSKAQAHLVFSYSSFANWADFAQVLYLHPSVGQTGLSACFAKSNICYAYDATHLYRQGQQ